MTVYLVRRFFFAILLVFTVSSASLLLARMVPGDYVTATLGIDAGAAQASALRAQYGLDRPLVEQYLGWVGRAAKLDFGESLLYGRPVRDLIPERAANTAMLASAALVVATLIGLPLGIVTGSRQGGMLPAVVRSASVLLLSLPPLLTSLFLVFFAARTGWFPIGGMRSSSTQESVVIDILWHLVVPTAALALPIAAMFERLQSQAMVEVLEQPYILAGLSRGVPQRRLIWRDALKAALRPTAGVYGLVVGSLLSGSFAVEMVTAWPGLGQLTLEALRARDVDLVAGCAVAGSVFLACGTLISDAALVLLDPRVREVN